MLRKILVLIDAYGDINQAAKVACWLASSDPAVTVSAIAVADQDTGSSGYAVGIGGMSYRKHLQEKMNDEAHRKLVEHENAFAQTVREAGLTPRIVEREGSLSDLVNRESLSHDLIVASLSENRDYQSSSIREALSGLVEVATRPIVIVGPDTDIGDSGPVVVAMNGSSQSSRALHELAQLGIGRDRGAVVACIGQSVDKSICEDSVTYLQAHGFEARTAEREGDDVAAALLTIATENKSCMIVMGGYSGSRLADWVLGSTTDDIIARSTIPVFVEA